MSITTFLDKARVNYRIREHHPTFTAQRMAAVEHEPGRYVAKPVIVKADGRYMMCVLAACSRIDLRSLKHKLGVDTVELVPEMELGFIFSDSELGAEPPFGNLYDLPTIIDKELLKEDHLTFQAGSHEKAITMSMTDYRRMVEPRILDFSYHTT